MSENTNDGTYRLLIIDDNRDIHKDIKILTCGYDTEALNVLEAELFGVETQENEVSSNYVRMSISCLSETFIYGLYGNGHQTA